MRRFLLCLTALCLAPLAFAKDTSTLTSETPLWQGIWRGTVGSQPIVACLDTPDKYGELHSAYYYLRHGTAIALAATDEQGLHWNEGEEKTRSGTWDLKEVSAKHLNGTWSAPNGGRRLPIALSRIEISPDALKDEWWDDHALCRSVAFYRARADADEVVADAPQAMGPRRFRELFARSYMRGKPSDPDILRVNQSIELLDADPHAAEVNVFLRDRWRRRLARSYVKEHGALAEFSESVSFLTERWLTLREMELPAGYPWSSATVWYETWNLATGKKVDPWSWFNATGGSWVRSNLSGRMEFSASPALYALARGHVELDQECAQEVSLNEARPSLTGITYSTGFGPCKQEFELPFKELLPFLNQEGQSEARLLITSKH